MHRVCAVVAAAGLVAGAGSSGSAAHPPESRPVSAVVYRAPVSPVRVVRPFAPPTHRYGPGHLGVDLAVPRGASVHAAGTGVVRFAGAVAGRGVVVVLHPDGISTEYEPLTIDVHVGAAVTAASVLGRVHGTHASGGHSCAPERCLHWGARRGQVYLDPMRLLRPLGPVRLLPYP